MFGVKSTTRRKSLNLKIPSRTEQLSVVREFVSEAARRFGFQEELVNKIALAVDEACTNIIKHSYEYSPNREIEISIKTMDASFEVIIADNGKSFEPGGVKIPHMREYLTHYRKGGLGMYLMRSLMDKVEYKKSNKKNEVHLIKLLDKKIHR